MFSAIDAAGNVAERHGFGECQARVLHYWKCGGEENMHHLHVGNIFLFHVCFLASTLYDHVFPKTARFQFLLESV